MLDSYMLSPYASYGASLKVNNMRTPLLLPPKFVGVVLGHCLVVHYFVYCYFSSFAIISLGKESAVYFTLLLFFDVM